MATQGWGVVRTLVSQEDCAKRYALAAGFEVFLPKFLDYQVVRGRRQARQRILFPSYLFAKITGVWHPLRRLPGVIDVVLDGETPATVREHEMAYLRERFDEEGTRRLSDGRFRRGQRVRALAGPCRDQTGLFDGMGARDRVSVLFEMMGRWVPVEMGERELAAA